MSHVNEGFVDDAGNTGRSKDTQPTSSCNGRTPSDCPLKKLATKKFHGKCPFSRHESVDCSRSYAPKKLWAKKRQGSLDATLAYLRLHPDDESLKDKWIDAYVGRDVKPANSYFRWNILMSFIIFITVFSPIWMSFIPGIKNVVSEICTAICLLFHIFWIIGLFNAVRISIRLLKRTSLANSSKIEDGPSDLKHLVGICIYKEPLNLMISTLDSVATQKDARMKISVVVGMEEGTPERKEKQEALRARFDECFERFFVVVHPKGLDGDIPGKCSNLNYAMRTAVANIRAQVAEGTISKSRWLVTTGDCDSVFGDEYFLALEDEFSNTPVEKRELTVWQSPLFYAINLHKSPFFVRVTGLVRSFFMMGLLIPLNINTMSIFSLTLELYEAGGYTHPGYQMEDIIAVIRWSLAVGRQCTIKVLPVATLSGPTSGKNYYDELYEWARQIRRWNIGAAEVFHYFCIKCSALSYRSILAFSLNFILYYAFLLCIIPLFGIVSAISLPIFYSTGVLTQSSSITNYLSLANFLLFYIEMIVVFAVNKQCEKVFPSGAQDNTGFFRSLLHYVLSFPTVIAYSVVAVFAYFEVTIRGKSVCSHSASKKDNLMKKTKSTQA